MGLIGGDCCDSWKHSVIDSTGVVEHTANDLLELKYGGSIKGRAGVDRGELRRFAAVGWWSVDGW